MNPSIFLAIRSKCDLSIIPANFSEKYTSLQNINQFVTVDTLKHIDIIVNTLKY
ncbi:MAG TPA: hypothetical protein VJN02_09090 [Gammaproteobacteria bacterium]|nr:hypothetical protein [Gammaproteobacteria bacterium]